MKAIEMLYHMFDEMNFESMRPEITEAIRELEALQSRSCEGCKYEKELKEVNSLLFGEGMATTARLKQCEIRKRR